MTERGDPQIAQDVLTDSSHETNGCSKRNETQGRGSQKEESEDSQPRAVPRLSPGSNSKVDGEAQEQGSRELETCGGYEKNRPDECPLGVRPHVREKDSHLLHP